MYVHICLVLIKNIFFRFHEAKAEICVFSPVPLKYLSKKYLEHILPNNNTMYDRLERERE